MNRFGRIITAMATPFSENGELNLEESARLVKMLTGEGSDSILVCGTTGESPVMTEEEQFALLRTAKEAAGDHPVIMGTGSNNTRSSCEKTRRAEKEGADGILAVVPYYNKPPQEGLFRHFSAIAESTSLPVILYNIPGRTGTNMANETVVRLHESHPNICALKDAAGNIDQTSRLAMMIDACHNESFSIYSGDDSLTLPMMSCGAKGVISVASHVVGPEMRAMIDSFLSGDVMGATELHLKLMPIFKGLFETTNPILVKAALNLRGVRAGSPRPPLPEATEEQTERLAAAMKALGKI